MPRGWLALPAVLLSAGPAVAAWPNPLDRAEFGPLTRTERGFVRDVVEHAPGPARGKIRLVAPYITFAHGSPEELGGGNRITTSIDARGSSFLISYAPDTFARRDALARHHVLHELGHAIDNGIVAGPLRRRFQRLFARHPAFNACFPQVPGSSGRCVQAAEVFAEQFAFYASGDRDVRTSYAVWPMFFAEDFGLLLRQAHPGRGTLLSDDPDP